MKKRWQKLTAYGAALVAVLVGFYSLPTRDSASFQALTTGVAMLLGIFAGGNVGEHFAKKAAGE